MISLFNLLNVTFLRFFSALIAFIFTIILTKTLTPNDVGVFLYQLTIVSIAAVFSRVGLEAIMVKNVSINNKNILESTSHAYLIIIINLIVSLLISIIFYMISDYIFKDESLVSFKLFIFSIVPMVINFMMGELAKGKKSPKVATLIQVIIAPLIFIFIILTSSESLNLTAVVGSYLQSTVIGFFISAMIVLYKFSHELDSFKVKLIKIKHLLLTGLPLLIATSLGLIIAWSDTIIIGAYSTYEDVAIYSIAVKISLIMTLVLMAVNSIVAPKYAQLYAENKIDLLAAMAQKASSILTIIALTSFVVLLILSSYLLQFFGEEYMGAAYLLYVLLIGQLVNVSTGSVSLLLNMTGHQKILMKISIISAVINIVLNILFFYFWGLIGVAIATTFTIALSNILQMYQVKKYLGFYSFSFRLR